MRITKLGHSCLTMEEHGVKILFDPGTYSSGHENVRDLDAMLITHQHPDHYSLDLVKMILSNNPGALIITNGEVGALLKDAGIKFESLEDGGKLKVKDVEIEGLGKEHAFIYDTVKAVVNTGYLVAGRFFHPGDNFYDPGRNIEILGLPVSAPRMKLAEALDYFKKIKPKNVFPIHDGNLKVFGPMHSVPMQTVQNAGSKFFDFEKESEIE